MIFMSTFSSLHPFKHVSIQLPVEWLTGAPSHETQVDEPMTAGWKVKNVGGMSRDLILIFGMGGRHQNVMLLSCFFFLWAMFFWSALWSRRNLGSISLKEFQLIDGESWTRFGHHGFNGSSPPSRPAVRVNPWELLFSTWRRTAVFCVGVKPFNKKMISRYECQKCSKLGICCMVGYIHFERMYEKNEF